MTSVTHGLDEVESHDTWPAFVDLFAATSLLFIAFIGVFVYLVLAQEGALQTTRRRLAAKLDSASVNRTLFTVDTTDRQFVRVVLRERATFPEGEYRWEKLRKDGKTALQQIGAVLNDTTLDGLYREVRVLGHTDQVPFVTGGFTNWELSASRAAVVARFLVNWVRVNPCKISAAGHGPYFPVSSDDMEANRRIEIQIVPRLESDADESARGCRVEGDGTRAHAASVLGIGQPTAIRPRSPMTGARTPRRPVAIPLVAPNRKSPAADSGARDSIDLADRQYPSPSR